MWPGGTVPTTLGGALAAIPNAPAAARLRAASAPQALRCATGVPVLPEVNTMAASRPDGRTGLSVLAPAPVGRTTLQGRGIVGSGRSTAAVLAGNCTPNAASRAAEASPGTRQAWPRSSAAANATVKA